MSRRDLQELKKQVGITPFSQRIRLSSDGYSPCPFHGGDGEKSFHIVQKEDGAFIGTCFSSCGKSFDAIAFVEKFDNVQTGEAIRKLSTIGEKQETDTILLRKLKPATPMTPEVWAKSGREVTDADVAKLSASRPNSKTPSARTLNEMGFKIGEKYGHVFVVAPYRMGNTFYTLKARNIEKKEFIQENSVSQQSLFNIDAVTAGCDVYVVESELDAAVLHESGYIAVSVINAKQKSIEPEVLKKLTTANRIFLVGDNDEAGQTCMVNLAQLLPAEKVYRLSFPDAKDVGELAISIKGNETILGDFREQWEVFRKDALASWVAHIGTELQNSTPEMQDEILDESVPEFPAITGSIAELADAMCPDIPREFKIMAAITRVGLAISGQVHLEGEPHLQPRFYTCFIAEAGRGKTAAIKETRVINTGYREVPSVDSAPALVDTFAESNDSPRRLLLSPDEAIDLFEKAKTSRDSRNSLFTELLKLYEDNVTGNRARRNESPIEIHDAHLAILCGATPSGYDGMWMGSRGASGGLQSRFIPVATTASPMPAKQRPSDSQRVHAAVAHIRQQIEGCSLTLLTMTAEAEAAFKAWWESIPKDKPSTVRVEALVKRFLMVLAVTNDTDMIGSGLMAVGVAFGDYIIAVRDRFNPADASSWVHAFENKIVACHERVGVPITRNHCRRLLHPERHPGGFGDFIRAYGNVIQAGRLVPRGKTERDLKYGLDSRDDL